MQKLSEVLASFKKAINLLTGYKRRAFVADLCIQYFDSSPTKIERYLSVKRHMVVTALGEARTGIRCLDAYNLRGRKKKN